MKRGKIKYYDVAHLRRDYPNCHYYMAFGERSNGKTYSALDDAIVRYFKTGEQFVYIRRYGEDVKSKRLSTLFDNHVQNGRIAELSGGLWDRVKYYRGAFFPALLMDDGIKVETSLEPMGYARDLNAMEHDKSTSYPMVTTVIFDEFVSRNGYLPNEFILFMNTLSTIIRSRSNVKIFMLGNTVNKFCPYFGEMGLTHVKEQKPGTVDVYTYGQNGLSVAVEYCDPISNRGGKESDVYFSFDNPQLKMITTGAWEISIYPHLERRYRPKDVITNFFILFDGAILHCEVVVTDDSYFIFIHPKTSPIKYESLDIIYGQCPDGRWNVKIGFNGNDRLSIFIKRLMAENRIFYSDNETGEVMRNYINWSQSYISARG